MNEVAINLDGSGLRVGIVRGRFNESIGIAMLDACRTRLAELGGQQQIGGTPEDFGKVIAAETEKWAKVIKSANVPLME